MATYLYQNQEGEEREIIASMTNAPPEHIIIDDDGDWTPISDEQLVKADPDSTVWSRVYGAGLGIQITNYACNPGKGGLPVSVSSPRKMGGELRKVGSHTIREHKDGTVTNAVGQPIIDSNAAAKNNASRTGMELD